MFKDFANGVSAYGKALQHISKYRMWGYFLLPGLLSILIGAIIFTTAYGLSDNIGIVVEEYWKWEMGKGFAVGVAQLFGGILIAAFGLLIFRQIVMVLLAPFMSALSEKVESQLTGKPTNRPLTLRQISKDLARGLRIAVRNLTRELLTILFLFLLGLIPLFTPFTPILIFIVQSYYIGFGNIDYCLERHFGYKESVRFVRKNRSLAIGNGAVFMLMLFTFIGFFFALPLGTVAATIETVKRLPAPFQETELV